VVELKGAQGSLLGQHSLKTGNLDLWLQGAGVQIVDHLSGHLGKVPHLLYLTPPRLFNPGRLLVDAVKERIKFATNVISDSIDKAKLLGRPGKLVWQGL